VEEELEGITFQVGLGTLCHDYHTQEEEKNKGEEDEEQDQLQV